MLHGNWKYVVQLLAEIQFPEGKKVTLKRWIDINVTFPKEISQSFLALRSNFAEMFWESESEIFEEKKYTLSPFENMVEQKTIWLAEEKKLHWMCYHINLPGAWYIRMGCQRQASSNPRLETRSCKSNWKVHDEADSCKMLITMLITMLIILVITMIIMMIITWSSFLRQFLICFSRGRIRWLSDWSNPSAIGPVAKHIVNNC